MSDEGIHPQDEQQGHEPGAEVPAESDDSLLGWVDDATRQAMAVVHQDLLASGFGGENNSAICT